MIQPAPDPFLSKMQARQEQAAANAVTALKIEADILRRVVACLARSMATGAKVGLVNGHVVVPREDLEAMPALYSLQLQPAKVRDEGAAEDVPERDVLVVVVENKPKVNGVHRPRLVMP